MKIYVLIAAALMTLGGLLVGSVPNHTTKIGSFFSPNGGCTDQVVTRINSAKKSIYVAAYQLTSLPIKEALIAAKRRGVEVKIVVDKEQKDHVQDLVKEGIKVWVDSKHAIFHFKFIVIDDALLLTGSFNYSANAEKHNAENLLTIPDTKTVEAHMTVWTLHMMHSQQLKEDVE